MYGSIVWEQTENVVVITLAARCTCIKTRTAQ